MRKEILILISMVVLFLSCSSAQDPLEEVLELSQELRFAESKEKRERIHDKLQEKIKDKRVGNLLTITRHDVEDLVPLLNGKVPYEFRKLLIAQYGNKVIDIKYETFPGNGPFLCFHLVEIYWLEDPLETEKKLNEIIRGMISEVTEKWQEKREYYSSSKDLSPKDFPPKN